MERIRLTRRKLAKWLNEPFFEAAAVGCFVRIGIGATGPDQLPQYRVAEITAVKDGFREYEIEGKVKTTKRLELAIGASHRNFQMSYVSNSDFEMKELEKYGRMMKAANEGRGLKTKTKTEIDEKVKELLQAKNHTYSEAEIGALVAQNQKSSKIKGNLAHQILVTREEIAIANQLLSEFKLEKAKGKWNAVDTDGEDTGVLTEEGREKESELTAAISSAEQRLQSLEQKQTIEKKIEQQREGSSFRINDINERNNQFQRSIEDKVGGRFLKEEIEISAGRAAVSDPFKRLPIRPVIYWDWENKKKKPEEASAAPAAAAPAAAKGAGSSSDPLVVDTAAAAAPADTLISPGFGALMDGGEPRVDPEDVVPQEGDGQLIVPTGAADDGDEVVGPDGKVLPKLSGRRAQAHAIELDIDIAEEVDTSKEAAQPQPKPVRPLLGSGARRPAESAGSSTGTKLSLKDYKKRAGMA